MGLLLSPFIVLCVSLSLFSAEEQSEANSTSLSHISSNITAHLQETTQMNETALVTNDTLTSLQTSAQATESELNTSQAHYTTSFSSTEQAILATLSSPTTTTSTSPTTKNTSTELSHSSSSTIKPIQSGTVLKTTSPNPASNRSLTEDFTSAPPAKSTGNGLTMVAFGVMSFILILIIVMVILVTAVNLRGRCQNRKGEGVKSYDSMISESNIASTGDKESITLVSVRTMNTETDTDSPQISSVHSTILDSEE